MSSRRWVSVLLLVTVAAGLVGAQPRGRRERRPPPEELQARRQRWERLAPAERNRLLQQYQRWQRLPEGEREALRGRLERLEGLPESQREVLRRRLQAWSGLTPGERQQMHRRLAYWRRLSAPEKERIARALWILKNLLPADFQTFKTSTGPEHDELRRRLAHHLRLLLEVPTNELQELSGLPPEARREAVERLLRERPPRLPAGPSPLQSHPRQPEPPHSGGR